MTVRCPTCGTELYVPDEGTFKRRCPCCKSLWEFRMGNLEGTHTKLMDGEDD